jgi:hypothetical protein
MSNYNFKKFFNTYKMSNIEYVSNGFFVIKRSCLLKSQNKFVDTFETDERMEIALKFIKDAQEKEYKTDSAEFIPLLFAKDTTNKGEEINVIINVTNICLQERFYNFFKHIKCRIFYFINESNINPLLIYNVDNELVGILLPWKLKPEVFNSAIDYDIIKQEVMAGG